MCEDIRLSHGEAAQRRVTIALIFASVTDAHSISPSNMVDLNDVTTPSCSIARENGASLLSLNMHVCGSSRSSGPSSPVLTLQKAQARVHVSPMIMKVA